MDIANASGITLNGKYELLEPIGQGGKSVVYKARDLVNNQIVACKILLPELINDELNLKRFRQEAVAAKRLDHININSVNDFGEYNGQPFMIMQFLEGLPLSDLITETGKLSPKRAIPIFIQIANGCIYAHSRNIIHRDLKPSNIVLTEKDNQKDLVKIIDFGIAKIISENTMAGTKLTKTGDIFGSPLYMSPEQCMGKTADLRSDIYSLGALMYETLTGEPPFAGETALVTIFKHIREMPAKFTQLEVSPRISQMIENIVFKCLAKEPKQRYQLMDEIIEAYNKILPLINSTTEQAAKP